jgi:Tfp pilus assembly protein PilF
MGRIISTKVKNKPLNQKSDKTKFILPAAGLVILTFAAYIPALGAGFVWDDDMYVTHNRLLTDSDGMYRIWFTTDSPSQYFPLVFTVFRLEYKLWGLNPAGYHIVNILLHIANVILLWVILRGLALPGAWFASALFAVHPVQVESVAWVTELKNVLMCFFFFLSFLVWLKFTAPRQNRKRAWPLYILSLLLYALALLSKTTACTMPAALVLGLWICRYRLNLRRWLQIAPYTAMGLAMGMLTIWWEQHHQGTMGLELGLSLLERLLIASRAMWFYLYKLYVPLGLTFSYPKWSVDETSPVWYVWLLCWLAVAVGFWYWRKKIGKGPVAGVVFFVATLSPMLSFLSLYTFRYTYVADHYQYIASIGVFALVAAAFYKLLEKAGRRYRDVVVVLMLVVVSVLGLLTFRQCRIYKNLETLWLDTLKKNPSCWMAHTNLGMVYASKGRYDQAISHYRRAIQINPDNAEAYNDFGIALESRGKLVEALEYYRKAVEIEPEYANAYFNLGNVMASLGRLDDAIKHFNSAIEIVPDHCYAHNSLGLALKIQGKTDESLNHFRKALDKRPDFLPALVEMTNILVNSTDPNLRDISEAIRFAERAAESTNYRSGAVLEVLSSCYAAAGQVDKAVETAQTALKETVAHGDRELAIRIRRRLGDYKQRPR